MTNNIALLIAIVCGSVTIIIPLIYILHLISGGWDVITALIIRENEKLFDRVFKDNIDLLTELQKRRQ